MRVRRQSCAGSRSSCSTQVPNGRSASRSPAAGSKGNSYSAKMRRASASCGAACRNTTAKSDGRSAGSSVRVCLIARAISRNCASAVKAVWTLTPASVGLDASSSRAAAGTSASSWSTVQRARSPAEGSSATATLVRRASAATRLSSRGLRNSNESTSTRPGRLRPSSIASAASVGVSRGSRQPCSSRRRRYAPYTAASATWSALPARSAAVSSAEGATSAPTSSATARPTSACSPGVSAIGAKRPAPPDSICARVARWSSSIATSTGGITSPPAARRAKKPSVVTSRLRATPQRSTTRRRNWSPWRAVGTSTRVEAKRSTS